MRDQASEKILQQLMDIVGANTALTNYESMIFSLQLLGWAKLSNANFSKDFSIQSLTESNNKWLEKSFIELSKQSDILKAAYSTWKIPARLSHSTLIAAVEFCNWLSNNDMLKTFDPTDCYFKDIGREAGEYSLPPELADVMIDLARIEFGQSAYTPWDNSIQLASRAAKLGANVYIEALQDPTLPALISLFVDGQIQVVHGDPIRNPTAIDKGGLRQFDVVLGFPPLGRRYTPDIFNRDLYGRFPERTNSGTVLAVRHILAQTRRRAVIAVPHSFLFSPGADRKVREELLERNLIEAVITMPGGLFIHTNISFALLVLNMHKTKREIRFVNAEDEHFREPISKARARLASVSEIVERVTAKLTDDFVAEVTADEIFMNDAALQVNRYVVSKSRKKMESLLKTSKTQELGEIVKIIRPMPTRTTSLSVLKAYEVGAADLPEFGYIKQPAKEVGIDIATTKRNNQQYLQPLDIVLIIKGSVGKIGIVPKEIPYPGEGGWVVGQSSVILRVTDQNIIDAKALFVFLKSPIGQEMMSNIAVKGATIPLIQQRELQKLKVIIPTKQEAVKIGNIIDEQASLQREIEQLRTKQTELAKRFWTIDE